MRVLVTGGAGFIGSHLVDALLQRGHQVRAFDSLEPQVHGSMRETGGRPDYLAEQVELVVGDIRDRDAARRALDGMEIVFHEAAVVGVAQSMYDIERYVDVNTRGTAVLLDLLANEAKGIRKLVVASSMSVYGEGKYACPSCGVVYPALRNSAQFSSGDWEVHCPQCGAIVAAQPTSEDKPLHSTSIYAISKKDQEEMCLCTGRAYGIPTVALRYFNVYGPRQALSNPYTGLAAIFSCRLLNRERPVVFEDGRQSRDYTHVSDIVRANLLAMESDAANYGVFNVGTGRSLTVLDVAELLCRRLGHGIEPEIVNQFRAGDIRHCYADISRAGKVLGYRPTVTFEEGIKDLLSWVTGQQACDRFDQARTQLQTRGLTV